MNTEKIIKPEQIIISITHKIAVTELPNIIGPSFLKLAEYIKTQGAEILSAPFVSYKNLKEDGEVDGDLVTVEIGFPIDRKLENTDQFNCYILPSYKAISTLLKGAYDQLTSPYLEMLAEIKKENGLFTGVSYEYYLTDEEIESDQHETILEVVYQS